jgi:hypothetical protein
MLWENGFCHHLPERPTPRGMEMTRRFARHRQDGGRRDGSQPRGRSAPEEYPTAVYLGAAFVILQLADLVIEPLGRPTGPCAAHSGGGGRLLRKEDQSRAL